MGPTDLMDMLRSFRPDGELRLMVTGDARALVGLVAVDQALLTLGKKNKLTQKKVSPPLPLPRYLSIFPSMHPCPSPCMSHIPRSGTWWSDMTSPAVRAVARTMWGCSRMLAWTWSPTLASELWPGLVPSVGAGCMGSTG